MREDTRTLVFAAVVCVTCSLLLSGAAAGLRDLQEANEAFDVKRNIVKAFGIDISSMTRPDIVATFAEHITEDKTADGQPIFMWTENDADSPSKYAFPVSGKGLWSMMYGYLALQDDLQTMAGISFYKHGETPGLGAEIEKPWFQQQFVGKKLYSEQGDPVEFMVTKPGNANDNMSVDGISGATLTSKGVQSLIREDAAAYENYFKSIKGN